MEFQNKNILIINNNISKIERYKSIIKKPLSKCNIITSIVNDEVFEIIKSNDIDLFIIETPDENCHVVELCSKIFSECKNSAFLIISEIIVDDTSLTLEEGCIFDYSTSLISDVDLIHKTIFLLQISEFTKKKNIEIDVLQSLIKQGLSR